MSQHTPGSSGAPTDDESVPWILRGRSGPVADAAPVDAPADDAPVSKFRRVSGAPTMGAATPVGRAVPPPPPPRPPAATSRATAYTPPPPPPPMEWDSEVETLRPPSRSSAPAWTPPPSRPTSPPPGPSAYSPSPRKKGMSGGLIAAIVAGGLVLTAGGVGGVLLLADAGTPSRAEFVADADDVCRPANGPVAAIVKPTSYPELATAAGTLNTTIDSQLGQLRALDQPGGGAKTDVAGVYTALEGTDAAAKRLQDAAGNQDDGATIAATKEMASQAGDARTRATTAGFAACSIGMQPGIDAVFGGSQSVIKAGFIAEADVLCRRAANDLEDIDFPTSDDARSFARYIGETIDIFDELVADIRALPVTPGEEATVDEIFTAQDKVQAKEREFQDAAADDDFDRMDALDREVTTLITAADAKWDAYGLGSCGSNFGFWPVRRTITATSAATASAITSAGRVTVAAVCWLLLTAAPGVAAAPSDDTLFDQQWNLEQIGAAGAWDISTGAGVKIGIVDSGIDARHPDLADKIEAQADCTDGPCQEGSASDGDGHGTSVAGVAAASTDNGTGIAGVAPDARLVVAKVLDDDGFGGIESINSGIRWVVDHGAKIVSLSLGDPADIFSRSGNTLASGIEYAWTRGAIPVLAAGNYNSGVLGTQSAGYGNLNAIVVGATDKTGAVAFYSTPLGNAKWGVVAPGGNSKGANQDILSTEPGGRYTWHAGTSLAVPHVSGALALILAQGLGQQAAVDRLLATLDTSTPCGNGCRGRLKADAAVQAAPSTTVAGPDGEPAADSGGSGLPVLPIVLGVAVVAVAGAAGAGIRLATRR